MAIYVMRTPLKGYRLHSEQVRGLMKKATSSFVSLITWAEMCSAFGLKERTQQITSAEIAPGRVRLNKEWGSFGHIAVASDLIINAGNFSLRFGLRACDSAQLASAQRVHKQLGSNLTFCCFDKRLNAAACALSIQVMAA